jgi:hypothetical protein
MFVSHQGGMEVDIAALKKGWLLVLINGSGQILLNFAFFFALGWAFFFGRC